jgi:superfamily II DNA/RNA helicase
MRMLPPRCLPLALFGRHGYPGGPTSESGLVDPSRKRVAKAVSRAKSQARKTKHDARAGDLEHLFHPSVAGWFVEQFGVPTPAQAEVWPAINGGRHTLIAAPTGSGKTLAAFLTAIDGLVRQGVAGRLIYAVRRLRTSVRRL